jgi:hypothetical protein
MIERGGRAIVVLVAVSALLRPTPAPALDISSTVSALGGAGTAIAGAIMMGNDDPEKKKTGKILLIVGLSVSAACSSSAIAIDVLYLISLTTTYDRVQALEDEVLAGGGPMLDAYATAFGLSHEEVVALVGASLESVPVDNDEEAEAFGADLLRRLTESARISEPDASRILYALYQERHQVGQGPAPMHDLLAELSGVASADLARTIDPLLEARVGAYATPGAIVSARDALARDASEQLDRVLDAILDQHADAVSAHLAELGARARALPSTR